MGNGKITKELKGLGLKINETEPNGETVSEVIKGIADDYEGGSSGIEYIDLVYTENEENLTQEQITKLQNGAFVKLYQETEGDPVLMGVAIPVNNGNYATSCIALDRPERTVYYGITIADDTYRCFTITLAEAGSGGTTVVANPTLAGTEDNLTGLQVGETKYKVEGQKLYSFYDILFNTCGKLLNWNKLVSFLNNLGIDTTAKYEYLYFDFGGREDQDYILQLSSETSGGDANYVLNYIYGGNTSTGFTSSKSFSELNFNLEPVTDLETVLSDYNIYYIQPYLAPILSYATSDNASGVKIFDWQDFFACFDTVNND